MLIPAAATQWVGCEDALVVRKWLVGVCMDTLKGTGRIRGNSRLGRVSGWRCLASGPSRTPQWIPGLFLGVGWGAGKGWELSAGPRGEEWRCSDWGLDHLSGGTPCSGRLGDVFRARLVRPEHGALRRPEITLPWLQSAQRCAAQRLSCWRCPATFPQNDSALFTPKDLIVL